MSGGGHARLASAEAALGLTPKAEPFLRETFGPRGWNVEFTPRTQAIFKRLSELLAAELTPPPDGDGPGDGAPALASQEANTLTGASQVAA